MLKEITKKLYKKKDFSIDTTHELVNKMRKGEKKNLNNFQSLFKIIIQDKHHSERMQSKIEKIILISY